MKISHAFKTALSGLWAHATRSALTILGIVIGVTSITLIQSVGQGAENLILGQIQGLGLGTIIIEPGPMPETPSDLVSLLSNSLKNSDLEVLSDKANAPNLVDLAPVVFVPGRVMIDKFSAEASTTGSTENFASVFGVSLSTGRLLREEDVSSKRKVAVLGFEVRQELFPNQDPVGQTIEIQNEEFEVIGTFDKKGFFGLFEVDFMVLIPYTTAQDMVDIDHYNMIITQAISEEAVPLAKEEILSTLRREHSIDDPINDDFHVTSQADAAKQVASVTNILTVFLSAIAAISLVVGGIGIMNIMLVAVTERTKEIGLRKALGARNRDILLQFLFEALLLTTLGGLIGIIFGSGLSFLASKILSSIINMEWTYIFPSSAAGAALVVAAITGIVFGLYPALRASRKSPIEALRYE